MLLANAWFFLAEGVYYESDNVTALWYTRIMGKFTTIFCFNVEILILQIPVSIFFEKGIYEKSS
ncbi:MAG: hypothetical protein A2096_11235 [Spirochaetes bacterium GWF1_41_5]|nr:MAG: hypothetical protein A2096_11235 [Spirochaetes bacterium GWF1_41_5]HBE04134.1 hypothetical protein [Spirochaetia bacterium]